MNLDDLSGDLGILTAAVFIAVVGLAILVLYAVAGKSAVRARVASRRVGSLRQRGFGGANAGAKGGKTNIRLIEARSDIPGLEEFAHKYLPRRQMLVDRLARTGRSIPLSTYALMGLATGALVCLIVSVVFKFPLVIGIFVGIAVGVGLPHLVVGYLIAKRARDFLNQFPEAIELIIRGIRSGLPVTEEIAVVGREIIDPVGIEFRRIADAIRFGQTLEDALWETARRLAIPDFNFFVISLSVQRETGGNLAETLENLAEILRKRRQMKLKIRAVTSEARASALILGSLPFIMFSVLLVLSPKYVTMLLSDPRGIMIGAGAVCVQALGGFIMAKMVRFEI